MSFWQLVLLAPVVFALHNVEEAPRMAAWSARAGSARRFRVTTPQFTMALGLLTLIMAASAGWAYAAHQAGAAVHVLFAFQAAVALNAVVPHISLMLRERRYNPGALTAMMLIIPFSIAFFWTAIREGYLSPTGMVLLFALAPVVMIGMAAAALWIGRQLFPERTPAQHD